MSVTVLIPVYDAAPFVAETVRAALAQTHRDLRLLIAVEPGGADALHEPHASLAALAEFETDPRVTLGANPARLGWTGNINRMLAAVETPYFAILPHDDLWHPRYVETLLALLEGCPDAGAAYSDIRSFGARRTWRRSHPIRRDADRIGQVLDFFLAGPTGMPWRGLIRTATLSLTGGFPDWDDLGMMAETEFALRLVAAARVLHHEGVLFAKRHHAGARKSASQDRMAAELAERRAGFAGHWLKMGEVVERTVAASLGDADTRLLDALMLARRGTGHLVILKEGLAASEIAALEWAAGEARELASEGESERQAPRFGREAGRIAAIAHVTISSHHRLVGELAAERDHAATAYRIAPDDPDAGFAHGRVLVRQGRILEAIEVLDRALDNSANPRHIERLLAGLIPVSR